MTQQATHIPRKSYLDQLKRYFDLFPICGVIGPRQCGKTTLAKEYAQQEETYVHFDLEDPDHYTQLQHPKLALGHLKGLVIIDEVQRMPTLFPYLRVLVDTNPHIKVLLLGSASPDLLAQSAETLAGRIIYTEMTPFSLKEATNMHRLWQRGGFPKAYLAAGEEASRLWCQAYVNTFLERDVKNIGFNASTALICRLWTMLAHYHGNLINYSELGRSLNLSDTTIRRYIDLLQHAFMVRVLPPWHENIRKRQVKAPQVYIRDSGLLHTLLGVDTKKLITHPKVGASWEGFALEEVIRSLEVDAHDCYFWRTQDGIELDLLIHQKGKKRGFEFKYTDQPKATASMHKAIELLELDRLTVITPTANPYTLAPHITVCSLAHFVQGREGVEIT